MTLAVPLGISLREVLDLAAARRLTIRGLSTRSDDGSLPPRDTGHQTTGGLLVLLATIH